LISFFESAIIESYYTSAYISILVNSQNEACVHSC